MKLLNIGFGNAVAAARILAVVSPDSAPIKRVVQEARERGMLHDAVQDGIFSDARGAGHRKQFSLHGCTLVSSAFFSSMRAAMVSGVTDERMT